MTEAPSADPMIELRGVHKRFGEKVVLQGVTMAVPKGISAVVMGGSGTGKSVLIKHIVQLLTPDQGEVWVAGRRMDQLRGDELDKMRLNIGYLFQGGALFDSMNVYQNIEFILNRHTSLNKAERKDRIMEALDWVNLTETSKQFPAELSGGQRKRIALARSVILAPQVMLYDEPTTGLDPVSVRVVSDLIVRLRDERGITSIAITHDLLCAELIADYVYFLSEGEFVAEGSLADLEASPHPELRNFFGN